MEEEAYFGEKNWEGVKDLPNSTSDRAKSLRHILEHLGNVGSPQEDREAIPKEPNERTSEVQESDNNVQQEASGNQQESGREEGLSEEVEEEDPSSEGEIIESSSGDETYQAPPVTRDPIYTRENPRRGTRERKSKTINLRGSVNQEGV
ncbi:uncharacterized protein LOC110227385 [Arabidopsis lyrata subsp. lyrata]|uniref:uncharacterized protein LOC110227385 n=1 Tax=Arabidopsis lyrata subsp. lyrata TaxID=81972 RepID=UPI000A29BF6F|nr:uncharacterized protein LOC110227385 [Arabidopsis lyrata subsp. lyrata]|eukprot:XP_020877132.1 uncharacterized protein LOC110227385 [Arabidopsis lyrata subsp. lyrata]